MRIFAYFGVCNSLITKRKPDLTRPIPGHKTWHSRIRGNQEKTRGNTMENVTISRETLEFLTRMVLDYSEYAEAKHEHDRIQIGHLQVAITALDLQATLDKEANAEMVRRNAEYKAAQEAKAAEEAAAK